MARSYYKFMLGAGSANAPQCREEGFIGVDFDVDEDLTGQFPENWRDFNKVWAPKLLRPGSSCLSQGTPCNHCSSLINLSQSGLRQAQFQGH